MNKLSTQLKLLQEKVIHLNFNTTQKCQRENSPCCYKQLEMQQNKVLCNAAFLALRL